MHFVIACRSIAVHIVLTGGDEAPADGDSTMARIAYRPQTTKSYADRQAETNQQLSAAVVALRAELQITDDEMALINTSRTLTGLYESAVCTFRSAACSAALGHPAHFSDDLYARGRAAIAQIRNMIA